jgi:hypothetical protein
MRTDRFNPERYMFSVQIREDLVIRISGLPHDLSKLEAEKLCRVIMAHVPPSRDGDADAS